MDAIVALAKRRGFIFQSSEIYGGLNGFFDYGPLGVELKRNIRDCWWNDMVRRRDDIVGLESSIIMHPKVWEASGHVAGFTDPLVDCKVCKERFRADKAPRAEAGAAITLTFADKGQAKTAEEVIEKQFGLKLTRDGRDLKGATASDRGHWAGPKRVFSVNFTGAVTGNVRQCRQYGVNT